MTYDVSLVVGPRMCRVKAMPPQVGRLLHDILAYLPATFNEFHPGFGKDPSAFMVRLYDERSYSFPTGLLPRVLKNLKAREYTVKMDRVAPSFTTGPLVYNQPHVLRDYQQDAVEAAIKWTRGVIGIPTSGGKTEVLGEIISRLQPRRTLFLVPSIALLDQTYERLSAMFPGKAIYRYGGGKKPPKVLDDSFILVGVADSVGGKENDKPVTERAAGITKELRTIDMVLVDEAHRTPAGQFKAAIKKCDAAKYVIGATATPFRNNNDELEMEAWIGPTIYSIDYETLIQRGFVVPPVFEPVRTLQQALEKTKGLKTMVFTEKKATMERYAATITAYNATTIYSDHPERDRILDDFVHNRIQTLVCTPMFDEGLNIPDIQALVFLESSASPVRLVQRIGRGMRLHPGKDKVLVVDVIDRNYPLRVEACCKVEAFKKRLGRRA